MFSYRNNLARRKLRGRRKVLQSSRKSGITHRLSVFRSNKHIYSQVIDINTGNVIACASTLEKEFSKDGKNIFDQSLSKKVGSLIAKRSVKANVKKVIFDKSGYKYHGKVKSLAEGAREAGLIF